MKKILSALFILSLITTPLDIVFAQAASAGAGAAAFGVGSLLGDGDGEEDDSDDTPPDADGDGISDADEQAAAEAAAAQVRDAAAISGVSVSVGVVDASNNPNAAGGDSVTVNGITMSTDQALAAVGAIADANAVGGAGFVDTNKTLENYASGTACDGCVTGKLSGVTGSPQDVYSAEKNAKTGSNVTSGILAGTLGGTSLDAFAVLPGTPTLDEALSVVSTPLPAGVINIPAQNTSIDSTKYFADTYTTINSLTPKLESIESYNKEFNSGDSFDYDPTTGTLTNLVTGNKYDAGLSNYSVALASAAAQNPNSYIYFSNGTAGHDESGKALIMTQDVNDGSMNYYEGDTAGLSGDYQFDFSSLYTIGNSSNSNNSGTTNSTNALPADITQALNWNGSYYGGYVLYDDGKGGYKVLDTITKNPPASAVVTGAFNIGQVPADMATAGLAYGVTINNPNDAVALMLSGELSPGARAAIARAGADGDFSDLDPKYAQEAGAIIGAMAGQAHSRGVSLTEYFMQSRQVSSITVDEKAYRNLATDGQSVMSAFASNLTSGKLVEQFGIDTVAPLPLSNHTYASTLDIDNPNNKLNLASESTRQWIAEVNENALRVGGGTYYTEVGYVPSEIFDSRRFSEFFVDQKEPDLTPYGAPADDYVYLLASAAPSVKVGTIEVDQDLETLLGSPNRPISLPAIQEYTETLANIPADLYTTTNPLTPTLEGIEALDRERAEGNPLSYDPATGKLISVVTGAEYDSSLMNASALANIAAQNIDKDVEIYYTDISNFANNNSELITVKDKTGGTVSYYDSGGHSMDQSTFYMLGGGTVAENVEHLILNYDPSAPRPSTNVEQVPNLNGSFDTLLTEEQARQILEAAGITLKATGNPAKVDGIRLGTAETMAALAKACGCNPIITAGTDGTHAPGTFSHGEGYKLDVRTWEGGFTEYITDPSSGWTKIGSRVESDGSVSPIYTNPDYPGVTAVREHVGDLKEHWDVQFKPTGDTAIGSGSGSSNNGGNAAGSGTGGSGTQIPTAPTTPTTPINNDDEIEGFDLSGWGFLGDMFEGFGNINFGFDFGLGGGSNNTNTGGSSGGSSLGSSGSSGSDDNGNDNNDNEQSEPFVCPPLSQLTPTFFANITDIQMLRKLLGCLVGNNTSGQQQSGAAITAMFSSGWQRMLELLGLAIRESDRIESSPDEEQPVSVATVKITINDQRGVVILSRPDWEEVILDESVNPLTRAYLLELLKEVPVVFDDKGNIIYSNGVFSPTVKDGISASSDSQRYTYVVEYIGADGQPASLSDQVTDGDMPDNAVVDTMRSILGGTSPFTLEDVTKVTYQLIDPNESVAGDEYYRYKVAVLNGRERTITVPHFSSVQNMRDRFSRIGFTGDPITLTSIAAEEEQAEPGLMSRILASAAGLIGKFVDALKNNGTEQPTNTILPEVSKKLTVNDIRSIFIYPNSTVSCPAVEGLNTGFMYTAIIVNPDDPNILFKITDGRCGSTDPLLMAEETARHLRENYGLADTAYDGISGKTIFRNDIALFTPGISTLSIAAKNEQPAEEMPEVTASTSTEQSDKLPNLTNTIKLEVKAVGSDGKALVDWTATDSITISSGVQLYFKWDAGDYQQCLPFLNDNGTYALTRTNRAMISGNTEAEGFNVTERTATYRLECGGQRNNEFGVDNREIKVTVQ